MQTKSELESWYAQPDPWGYTTNPDDERRKKIILEVLDEHGPFTRALDIGCGEGFVTKDVPADNIYGIEISDEAAGRLPNNVTRIKEPKGKYDLILCTGMLYQQYDHEAITRMIEEHAGNIVVTSNIKDWEINKLPSDKQIKDMEFPYREYVQKLRVYKW